MKRRWEALAIVATLVAVPLAGTAEAGPPVGGVIYLSLDAAPDVEPIVSPRLMLDGAYLTDSYCAAGGEAYGAQIACTGLPNGEYEIAVSGVPDGLRTAVNCTDIVAAQAIDPIISSGFSNWVCQVFVGSPAVVLTVNRSIDDDPPDDVLFTLAPVEGIECIDDTLLDVAAVRCRNLVVGEYALALSGVPSTFVASEAFCETAFFTADFSRVSGSVPTISDDRWLWRCDVSVVPRALIQVQTLSADLMLPPADQLGLEVTGPDGDVTSRCPLSSGAPTFGWTFSCRLDIGHYQVAFSGLPDATLDSTCDSFDLTADQTYQVSCYWSLVLDPDDVVVTLPLSTTPPPTVDELPPTGSSSSTLPIALSMLLAGAMLVGLARRRSNV